MTDANETSGVLRELEHLANCPSWCAGDNHIGDFGGPAHLTTLVDLDAIEGQVRVFGQHEPDLGQGVCVSADSVMTPSQARRLATELLRLADVVSQP